MHRTSGCLSNGDTGIELAGARMMGIELAGARVTGIQPVDDGIGMEPASDGNSHTTGYRGSHVTGRVRSNKLEQLKISSVEFITVCSAPLSSVLRVCSNSLLYAKCTPQKPHPIRVTTQKSRE